ncbi:MAG TPA: penicillin acylase family protein [Thermoanaerobaculia bacterium]
MRRRTLRIAAAAVLAALLALVAAAVAIARSGRPQRQGTAPLAGLAAPVEVRFDQAGVPAVRAGSAADAMAALGWVHANDRLFQMEVTRRAAGGRLAELFGERALEFDRRVRRLGFGDGAARLLAAASPQTRELLAAYAAGVNAWLAARGGDLPPELRLLRRRPEPWRPEDSVAVINVMARTLSPVVDPPEHELFRLLAAFGPERARELALDPRSTIFDEVVALARAVARPAAELGERAEGAGLGSNNWAVAASRSATDSPLLANDPHLALGLPNVWYQARIVAPDYDAAGMTLPGAPAVVLGRGPRVAWACTNLYLDDVDVFVERLDERGERVARAGGWAPIAVERQTIRAGDRAVEVEVRRTDRGYLLPADAERGLPARSVAWTGWQPADQLAAFVALARAATAAEIREVVAPYVFPAQNLVVATAGGEILWTPLGRGPRRVGWDGRFPAPAWRADVGWDGLVPSEENPVLIDPPSGEIATANSVLPVERPAWFGEDFDTPFRLDRIRERLASRRDWTVAELVALQTDDVSRWARLVVANLGDGYTGDAAAAAAAFAAWDGRMAASGPAALFALVERELQRAIFDDEAERAGVPRFATRKRLLALLEGRMSAAWFDDVGTDAVEDRHAILQRALAAAWRAGVARWGERVGEWPYASLRRLVLDHPLGGLPGIGRWLNRGPFAVPGSATTILAFGGPWRGDAIEVTYGPSMRFATDAADPESTLAILPGGQSGHPFDRHYDDQLADFLAGRARDVAWSEAEIARATVSTLRLEPASGERAR